MDIRNKVMYKKIGDVEYDLIADYNTIMDIQAEMGNLNALIDGTAYLRVAAIALTSMLNGCAHRHHWPQHFDIHDVSKYMPPISDFPAAVNEAMAIVRFVRQAIIKDDEVETKPEGSAEKN